MDKQQAALSAAAELVAAHNRYTHDTTIIRGKAVRHVDLCRKWACRCGGKLTTRFFEDEPNWRTVCMANPEHDPDGFITKSAAEYNRNKSLVEAAVANEVLSHLPPELQAAIMAD